jgi:hypothetical protein
MPDCTISETILEKREQGGDMVYENIVYELEHKKEMPDCLITETTLGKREQGKDMVDENIVYELERKKETKINILRTSEIADTTNSNHTSTKAILEKREQGRDMVGLDIAKECEQKKREHTMLRASTFGTVGPPDYSTSKATTDKREQGRDMVDRIIDKGLEQRKRLVRNIDIDCKEERKKNEKIESEEEEDKKNGSQEIQDWKISLGKTTDGSPRRVRMTSMRTRMGSPKDLERLKPGMKTKVAKLPLSLSPSKVIDGTGLSSMKHLIKTRENRISLEDTVLTFSKTRKPRLDPKQELTNGIRVKKTFAGKLGTG